MTQFLTDIDLIKAWLKEYNIKRYTINVSTTKSGKNTESGIEAQSFTVDVHENVVIGHGNLKVLPIKFGVIEGSFNLYNHRHIKDLKGCPRIVRGNFNWERTGITSLKGCPKVVDKSFSVGGNRLTSLDGSPIEVDGYFECSGNQLKSLKGSPKVIKGSFRAAKNQLKTLEGCPLKIGGFFNCKDNPIEHFQYIPDKLAGELQFTVNEKIAEYEGLTWPEIEKMNITFKEKNNLDRELEDYADPTQHGPVFKL